MRYVLAILFIATLGAAGAYWRAGNEPGPTINFVEPATAVGRSTTLTVRIGTPGAQLTRLDLFLDQDGASTPLFSLPGNDASRTTQPDGDTLEVSRPIGSAAVPSLKEGAAMIRVTATRPTLFGWRSATSTASREVVVRLSPPRAAVVSRFHFVNHGGSEMVVYRVTPPDVTSGVVVGDVQYAGFPAANAGVAGADPSLHVAFFAILHHQDLATPVAVFARDEVGNESTTPVDVRVFPKAFRRSKITVDDPFLARVVPAIVSASRNFGFQSPEDDLLARYLEINGEQRRANDEQIEALAAKTAAERLWDEPFQQLSNSQVEASFADSRTYFYKGKEIDRQVHLGFDLAVTAGVPITAANSGTVLWADFLGIYGNCVVLDHGMGVMSLYAHLSSIDVKPGEDVPRGHVLGRSGMTGLAGGDHLHFTMLVGGHAVNPVDWWSTQWIDDRILRKLNEATNSR